MAYWWLHGKKNFVGRGLLREAVFFILFLCFGNGGFNLLGRGDSPSKKTPNNSNRLQFGFIIIVIIVL